MREQFSYNNQYLMKNGKPWFPVMGEMHFTRYREELWEESLRKIKAGGADVVSTYLIWIHHEEEQGVFHFEGNHDLHHFLELCKKVGIYVFLRLGPWVHGEVRNGGFPDWLQHMEQEGIQLRSNDPQYLFYVKRLWKEVFAQADGFFLDQDGPVIGIQIENEYGHVGGLNGEPGEAHMRTLTALAGEIGFRAPLMTATGWGGACIGDLLPVMGGYCEAPWDQSTTELAPNTNYVFSHERNDALIACDHHVEDAVTFDEAAFPYLTAELGGGLQVTAHRRPVATGKDIGAMSVAKLGSGVALLGYYMYHGGSNPEGKFSTLQESRATGYANDLPEINYDFNAPIRQYGTISDTYREIRLLASFLNDFGGELAVLPAEILPEDVKPSDFQTLRYACRHDADHGFVFFNNYQRRHAMKSHQNVILEGICDAGKEAFAAIDIQDGEYGFFPYHWKIGEYELLSATAIPFCRIEDDRETECTYVFYGDWEPHFNWKDRAPRVLHLTRKEALHASKVTLEREYLVLAEDYVWEQNGKLVVTGEAETVIRTFPEMQSIPTHFEKAGQDGEFTIYKRIEEACRDTCQVNFEKKTEDTGEYKLTLSYQDVQKRNRASGRDTVLLLTYAGERMEVYMDDKKINDYFYTGQQAVLSLGYFDFPKELKVIVHALQDTDPIFLETRPDFTEGKACALLATELKESYR